MIRNTPLHLECKSRKIAHWELFKTRVSFGSHTFRFVHSNTQKLLLFVLEGPRMHLTIYKVYGPYVIILLNRTLVI